MTTSTTNITSIRPSTAKTVGKALVLLYEVDAISWDELTLLKRSVSELAKGGEQRPLPERLVTQEQVAETLQIGLSTLKRLLASGEIKLPRKLVGGSVRFRLKDVVAYMDSVTPTVKEGGEK